MTKSELKKEIRKIIKNGCSDNNCEFVNNTVGTNGGCRCLDVVIELAWKLTKPQK